MQLCQRPFSAIQCSRQRIACDLSSPLSLTSHIYHQESRPCVVCSAGASPDAHHTIQLYPTADNGCTATIAAGHGEHSLDSTSSTGGGRRRRRQSASACTVTFSRQSLTDGEHTGASSASGVTTADSKASKGPLAAEGHQPFADQLAATQFRSSHIGSNVRRRPNSRQTDIPRESRRASSVVPADQDAHIPPPSTLKGAKAAAYASAANSISNRGGSASRVNPVLRAIRIMQLKKQQHRKQFPKDSSIEQDGHTLPKSHLDSELGPSDDQQQQIQSRAAALPSSGSQITSQQPATRRPALPADEVLITDTSHLNPVYRRIRLQELRLKLQERLRGPQLQRQLLQVQQEQQQQQLSQQQTQPALQQDLEAGVAHKTPANHSSGYNVGADNTLRRGATQGLNSIQRTIRIAQLQSILQQRYKAAHVSRGSVDGVTKLLEPGSPATRAHDSRVAQLQQRHGMVTTGDSAADAQVLLQQLLKAGVPAAQANMLATLDTKSTATAAVSLDTADPSSLHSGSSATVHRLLQLQELLGLPGIAAAAKIVNQQPNLLKRDPATLRCNLEKLSHALQLPQQKIQKLLIRYPAALDMCPASVISRAAALAEVLEVPAHQAIKVACDCPRVLGLSPDTLTAKVSELQAALELPSKAAAVNVILGFPAVLGVSTDTLAGKYQRLKGLVQQRNDWWQQFMHLRYSRAGTLGRVLAAGPSVMDRLQYLLEASCSNTDSVSSIANGVLRSSEGQEAGDQSAVVHADDCLKDSERFVYFTKSSVKKGGLPGGNFAALLIMSKADFTSMHPEFVLWQLKQRTVANQQ